MGSRHLFVILGLGALSLAGCLSPVRQEADALVCKRATIPIDVLPPPPPTLGAPGARSTATDPATQANTASGVIQQTGGKDLPVLPQPKAKPPSLLHRLELQPGILGADAPKIVLPPNYKTLPAKEQQAIRDKYFPPQLVMGPDPAPMPGPQGRPLTLADLQRQAREHSPLLRQAAADVKAADGAAVQAGLYPNPTVGLSTNSIGPNGGPLFGPYISQLIKTMGKLKLAQAMASMDLANAQLAHRRAETDLMASVRTSYFAVLAAEAGMKANRALADLTDEVYKVMLLQLKAGEIATYEPLQVSVYASQARVALIQSRNGYLLAWKQLASAMGVPAMPATELAGSLDQNLPRFDYEKALAHVLANHTDALTSHYTIEKARYNLRLAQVTPIPDVTLQMNVLYDATPPGPPRFVTFFGGNFPLAVWDRNQGGIRQAQGQLLRAIEEPHRVRSDLTARLSDAYKRVQDSRQLLDLYRLRMLPQQAQAFRAVVQKHFGGGDALGVGFNDLITAEQNVVGLIGSYLTTLGMYWQAVSDVASLLQTDDVYQMADEVTNGPAFDLEELLQMPCCHPCASLPDPALKGVSSFESPPGQPVAPEVPAPVGGKAAPAAGPQAAPLPALRPVVRLPALAPPTGAASVGSAAPGFLAPVGLPAPR